MSHRKDTVLYVTTGRVERPVMSFAADDTDIDIKMSAHKQQLYAQAVAAGSPPPTFRVDIGHDGKDVPAAPVEPLVPR